MITRQACCRPPARAMRSRSADLSIFWLLTETITISPFWKPSRLRRRAVGDADDHDAVALQVEPQLIGQRRRQVSHGGAEERRPRADLDLLARHVRRDLQSYRDDQLFALAEEADLRRAAERLGGETIIEGIGIIDDRAVDADDEVAGLEAGARRRTLGGERSPPARRSAASSRGFRRSPASLPAAWRRATAA